MKFVSSAYGKLSMQLAFHFGLLTQIPKVSMCQFSSPVQSAIHWTDDRLNQSSPRPFGPDWVFSPGGLNQSISYSGVHTGIMILQSLLAIPRPWGGGTNNIITNGYVRGALECAAAAWLPAASPSHMELVGREARAAYGGPLSTPRPRAHGGSRAADRRNVLTMKTLSRAITLPVGDRPRRHRGPSSPASLDGGSCRAGCWAPLGVRDATVETALGSRSRWHWSSREGVTVWLSVTSAAAGRPLKRSAARWFLLPSPTGASPTGPWPSATPLKTPLKRRVLTPALLKIGSFDPPRFENEVAKIRCFFRFLWYFGVGWPPCRRFDPPLKNPWRRPCSPTSHWPSRTCGSGRTVRRRGGVLAGGDGVLTVLPDADPVSARCSSIRAELIALRVALWFRRRFDRPTCGFEGGAADRRIESGDRSNLGGRPLLTFQCGDASPIPTSDARVWLCKKWIFRMVTLRATYICFVSKLLRATRHTRAICVCVYVGKYVYSITSAVILVACTLHLLH